LSPIDLEKILELLKEFVWTRRERLEITLLGGLAVQYYGMENRATIDIDAEIIGDLEALFNFLKSKNIPADIGENISGWSVVSMPQGYRERVIEIYRDEFLTVNVLDPLDFIIAKLRRFTEEDIEDALFVAKKYNIKIEEIEKRAEEAIRNSPKDTVLFLFRKNINIFIALLQK